MLKNRNSFFQEANMSSSFAMPGMQNPMMFNMPYQSAQASQSFYSGNSPMGGNSYNNFEDYENRLAKLERQLNRLDTRITKLENAAKIESIDISNSMYMV